MKNNNTGEHESNSILCGLGIPERIHPRAKSGSIQGFQKRRKRLFYSCKLVRENHRDVGRQENEYTVEALLGRAACARAQFCGAAKLFL